MTAADNKDRLDDSHWPLNSLLVSQQHRVIFTPVAKNANTTFKRLFVELSGRPEIAADRSISIHQFLTTNRTGLSLCDYPIDEAREMLADEQYFHFAVLRDPLERARSAYLNKFVVDALKDLETSQPPEVISAPVRWVYASRGEAPDFRKSISFEEFVAYLSEHEDEALDTHFKSQSAYLVNQSFDFVGSLENQRELSRVLASVFGQKIRLKHFNRTARRLTINPLGDASTFLPPDLAARRYLPATRQLMTTQLQERLRRRYAQDFERWQSTLD